MRLLPQPSSVGSPGKPALLITLFLLWLSLNAFFLIHNGIITSGEADAYIRFAPDLLRSGHLPSANLWLYSIPIALIACSIKFNLGYAFVIAVQLACNLAATAYFFHTVRSLFVSSPLSAQRAALATAILLLDIPYQTFNTYLQTESLFHSLSLLLTCYCLRQSRFTAAQVIFTLVATTLLCMVRPLGVLYWPAILTLYYYTGLRNGSTYKRLTYIAIATIGSIYMLNLVIGSGGQFDFLLPFREEHIICGAPSVITPDPHTAAATAAAMPPAPATMPPAAAAIPPAAAAIPAAGTTTILDLAGFIIGHPLTFIRLAALRSLSFWGIYRSWYSTLHNAWLIAFFIPLITLAATSLRYWRRHHPAPLIYISIVILLTWGTVIMTCDDWSNRIFLSITPHLILLAAAFRVKQ